MARVSNNPLGWRHTLQRHWAGEFGKKTKSHKRVAELKEAQSQKSELSRDQVREFLVAVILTPAGKVDEQSRLCQSYKATPEVREVRMPDKLRAVEQLVKLCGWSEAEKVELGANSELAEVLKRLRES